MEPNAHGNPGSDRGSFGSVVVATDLSDGSDEIVRVAAQVAARSAASLHVVHTIDALPAAGEMGDTYDERAHRAERLVDELVARAVPSSVAVHRHVESGPPDRAILEWADRADAGLIVVGPHVRRAGVGGLLGSTAERVLSGAGVPCLVVRAPWAEPSHHVVAAVDPAHAVDPVLDAAIHWALLFGGGGGDATRVSALYVTGDRQGDPPSALDQAFRQALSRGNAGDRVAPTLAVRGTDVVESILLFAEVEAADLLALSTRNRGIVGRALLGSVSAEVTRRAPCNVLLVPPRSTS